MNDASLFPSGDGSQEPQDDLVQIVDQISPKLGKSDGAVAPLEGGITNRNYRIRLGGTEYVIRVPGKDTSLLEIDRACEVAANERASRLGVAPPVAAALTDPAAIVTEFVAGTGMEPAELREPSMLAKVARALWQIHDGEAPSPCSSFDSFRLVETYAATATERGATLPPAYDEAQAHARRIELSATGGEHDPVPCHNDLLAANFIRGEGDRIWIVDWEYAGMGDRYFDLANFAVNNELDDGARTELLGAYFGAEPSARQTACLHLFMFMSDFREAMWGVVQSVVSELDFDFDEYATKHFTRMLVTAADPRFDRWLEEAGGASG
jgi:thiamine kinase-like enzyme